MAGAKDRQNFAAAALLLAVLAGLALFLLLAVIGGFNGSLTGEKGLGKFIDLVLGSRIDSKLLNTIAAILGVGSAYVAGGALSNRLFYTLVGLAALGAFFSLLMIVLLSGDALASALYNYAPERIANAEDFRSAVNWGFGGLAGWLLGVLGVQVGLHAMSSVK
jgi:hypothetical protein